MQIIRDETSFVWRGTARVKQCEEFRAVERARSGIAKILGQKFHAAKIPISYFMHLTQHIFFTEF